MPQANQQAKWYSIRSRASAQGVKAASAEILIYGDIGESWYGDSVLAKDFVKDIAALDVESITIRVNSYGGSVTDGIAIHNAIKRHKAHVTVVIDSVAYSIASLIAMAGDTVEMAENALLMVHAPWGYASGNSAVLREYADMLDTWAQAMSTSYAAKTGRDQAEMLALLTDGQDHYYTAQQAIAEKFVDAIVTAMPLAASLDRAALAARFKTLPGTSGEVIAAAAATTSKETDMPGANQTAATVQAAATNEAEIMAAGVKAEAARRTEIQASFNKFKDREGVAELLAACQNDTSISAATADAKLLAHLGKDSTPVVGSHIVTLESGRERFVADAAASIMARAGVKDEKGEAIKVTAGNSLRGYKLLDLARSALQNAGIKTDGMNQMQIVASAFTQSTSDFPILLENVMHKTLQQAYAVAPDTWSRFCAVGSVSDFRAHSRYRVGSLGNLDNLTELGEFKNKTIPDGEKASITAGTKGNIINLSRHTVINDDLQAFVTLSAMLGRAAKRAPEVAVYALLAENSGAGPLLSDGLAMFHAMHGNLVTSGAVPSIDTIEAARILMASQKDVSGNDYLDLRPAVWLGPMSLGGKARVVNSSIYDPDTANKLQRPNICNGLFRDVIDTPRLTGNPWYMFADPNEAPVIEVAFLDGVQEPYLELEQGFDVDGARYKVRLDFGVAGIDYRGAVQNDGA